MKNSLTVDYASDFTTKNNWEKMCMKNIYYKLMETLLVWSVLFMWASLPQMWELHVFVKSFQMNFILGDL